jgi:hypothetical protein
MIVPYDELIAAKTVGDLQILPESLLVVLYNSDGSAIRVDLLEVLADQDAQLRRMQSEISDLYALVRRKHKDKD